MSWFISLPRHIHDLVLLLGGLAIVVGSLTPWPSEGQPTFGDELAGRSVEAVIYLGAGSLFVASAIIRLARHISRGRRLELLVAISVGGLALLKRLNDYVIIQWPEGPHLFGFSLILGGAAVAAVTGATGSHPIAGHSVDSEPHLDVGDL